MKKTLLILVALIFAVNLNSQAEDFSAVNDGDTIYYKITSSVAPFTVEVTYRGELFNYYADEYIGDVYIPDSVEYNGNYYKVTSIGDDAFHYSPFLTSVIIPNSVTSIGTWAFSDCTGLTSITIPNSVTSIGEYAFGFCSDLTSITIPNSVISIGLAAFANTPYLNNMPDGVVYINNVLYGYKGIMPQNTSISVQSGTISISGMAFYYFFGLTSITIPNSVTSIGELAFAYCVNLTSVNIPDSVTTILRSTFSDCNRLTPITIPSSVTSIGESAFENCVALTSITCLATTPPSLGNNAFLHVDTLAPLYVPEASIPLYQATEQWQDFYNIQSLSLNDITSYNNITSKLYPNPTSNKSYLEIEGLTSETDVLVYDMIGRVIKNYKINQGTKELEIDLSTYAKGVYSIRIVNETINQTKKLIVQ